LGSCPTFLSEAKPALLFIHFLIVFKGIHEVASLSSLDTKSKQKNQGSILSFPPDVGIIFACKIATFRVIFEQRLSASRKVPAFCFIKISR